MPNRVVCAIGVLILFFAAWAAPASAAGNYSVTKKISINGQGSWDYLTVDEANRRLYVSHGTRVEVLDIDSMSAVGNIPNTPGVHGIAIAPRRAEVSSATASPRWLRSSI